MKNTYQWGEKACVRKGKVQQDEQHPCYFCGKPFPISTVDYCRHCHFAICPSCGKCYCNTSEAEREALQILRDTFCCVSVCFRVGLSSYTMHSGYANELTLVPHFKDALDYCRSKEGYNE